MDDLNYRAGELLGLLISLAEDIKFLKIWVSILVGANIGLIFSVFRLMAKVGG